MANSQSVQSVQSLSHSVTQSSSSIDCHIGTRTCIPLRSLRGVSSLSPERSLLMKLKIDVVGNQSNNYLRCKLFTAIH